MQRLSALRLSCHFNRLLDVCDLAYFISRINGVARRSSDASASGTFARGAFHCRCNNILSRAA
jgi:hypothetical protein